MAELLRRLKRHARGYYNFAKSVIYKHLFEACPGVNSILFLLSHFQLAQQVNLSKYMPNMSFKCGKTQENRRTH